MIKNPLDYVVTTLGFLLVGWLYEEIKNISLGFFFYFAVPIVLYGVFYLGEKILDKILMFLIKKGRMKLLYFVVFGFGIGVIGEYLGVSLVKEIGGVITLLSLFLFFFWNKMCKEIRNERELN
jgi:hypothetical protein